MSRMEEKLKRICRQFKGYLWEMPTTKKHSLVRWEHQHIYYDECVEKTRSLKRMSSIFWKWQERSKVVATSITTIRVQRETRYGKVIYIWGICAINLNVNNIM
jgi:hypothetical protein